MVYNGLSIHHWARGVHEKRTRMRLNVPPDLRLVGWRTWSFISHLLDNLKRTSRQKHDITTEVRETRNRGGAEPAGGDFGDAYYTVSTNSSRNAGLTRFAATHAGHSWLNAVRFFTIPVIRILKVYCFLHPPRFEDAAKPTS